MSEIPNLTLGNYLKEARLAKSLSQRAVEEATEISNAYLSQLESGKVKQPSPVTLHQLAELYGVPYADLMILAGYPVPSRKKLDLDTDRILARFGSVSEEEAEALSEYLNFLRKRRFGGPK
jgi:HTH-type transcriptional regulator, competence development regulator